MKRETREVLVDTALVAGGCWLAIVVISLVVKKVVVQR